MAGTTDGKAMLAGVDYVRDVYRTAARMLLSADALLADRGYAAYSWHSIWPQRKADLSAVDGWLPTSCWRHYFSKARGNAEVLTLACVFYSADARAIPEPLCIASHMFVASANTNDVYRWAIVQRWALQHCPPDGVVRLLRSTEISFDDSSLQASFEQNVLGRVLATVAVPLLSIRSTAELERAVVDPMIAFGFAPAETELQGP